ncbi:C40 family peptidase [Cohnella fermenti]|uniref:NlpC/P60 domain-containing protein n=1 Tax=Cohnella fermenti TaxID=2565925 RepID=A0A4S4C721_9BACL|nr:C40 family peptidase [Cohnella fermenti]THF83737.1 hypothetical protein E6C55_03340 [Cohnella fermenti]
MERLHGSKKRTNLAVAGIATVLSLVLVLSGCSGYRNDAHGDAAQYSSKVKVKTLEQTRAEEAASPSVVRMKTIHHSDYVALGDVARAIGFHAQWLPDGSYGVGDNDAAWTFKPGESSARFGDDTVKLPAPAVKMSNRLYVPVKALQALFGKTAVFRSEAKAVSFYPATDHLLKNGIRAQATRPSRNDSSERERIRELGVIPFANTSEGSRDAKALIADARKYLGIQYDFGAGDYASTGKFDCSSFVQLLFAKYGVDMPRVARNQAERGKKVARSELRMGDLLFFYVPGRFKSDETVGHVGIYMGDGNMIHASPKPEDGVQITPIDKAYWADTFLFAKRVLPD